mmetsp:Transcript_54974/g.151292  ORF Transcript_54974/g.151292 Transcript_54974/m.151292 type:complete len:382 (+) Transcript_54974:72-1217(+)
MRRRRGGCSGRRRCRPCRWRRRRARRLHHWERAGGAGARGVARHVEEAAAAAAARLPRVGRAAVPHAAAAVCYGMPAARAILDRAAQDVGVARRAGAGVTAADGGDEPRRLAAACLPPRAGRHSGHGGQWRGVLRLAQPGGRQGPHARRVRLGAHRARVRPREPALRERPERGRADRPPAAGPGARVRRDIRVRAARARQQTDRRRLDPRRARPCQVICRGEEQGGAARELRGARDRGQSQAHATAREGTREGRRRRAAGGGDERGAGGTRPGAGRGRRVGARAAEEAKGHCDAAARDRAAQRGAAAGQNQGKHGLRGGADESVPGGCSHGSQAWSRACVCSTASSARSIPGEVNAWLGWRNGEQRLERSFRLPRALVHDI